MKRRGNRKRGKANKRRRPVRPAKNKFVTPRTVEEFFAMSTHDQDLWKNVTQVVTEVRAGVSLRRASRKFGLDPRTVQRLAPSALRKLRNGRWVARPHDRLLRVLVKPTQKGLHEIGVRDSRQASLLGKYWVATSPRLISLSCYWSFACSALASFRMGMSGSASFQRAKKSW
jgi:hypothetical protein